MTDFRGLADQREPRHTPPPYPTPQRSTSGASTTWSRRHRHASGMDVFLPPRHLIRSAVPGVPPEPFTLGYPRLPVCHPVRTDRKVHSGVSGRRSSVFLAPGIRPSAKSLAFSC
jgi:hypothetical protein